MITSFVVPISIVMALGLVSGMFWHRALRRYWLASGLAAVTAGFVWVIGCEVLLSVTAPSEAFTGKPPDWPYMLKALTLTPVVALFPALLAGLLFRNHAPHSDRHSTNQR